MRRSSFGAPQTTKPISQPSQLGATTQCQSSVSWDNLGQTTEFVTVYRYGTSGCRNKPRLGAKALCTGVDSLTNIPVDRVIPTHVSNAVILATIQHKLPGNPLGRSPDIWEPSGMCKWRGSEGIDWPMNVSLHKLIEVEARRPPRSDRRN